MTEKIDYDTVLATASRPELYLLTRHGKSARVRIDAARKLGAANRCVVCEAAIDPLADRQDFCPHHGDECNLGLPHDDEPLIVTDMADRHPADGPILPGHHAGPLLPAELVPSGVRIATDAAEAPHVSGEGPEDAPHGCYAVAGAARRIFERAAAQRIARGLVDTDDTWKDAAKDALAAARAFEEVARD